MWIDKLYHRYMYIKIIFLYLICLFREKLVEKMKAGPYAIFTDGSNDNDIKKMMPLTISVLDEEGVKTEFLDMGWTERTTAEGML